MNEAQKMATAIRNMMTYEKDALVDMLICLAAVAPAAFLSDVAERSHDKNLVPGSDTIGTDTKVTKVLVPSRSHNFGSDPAVESLWTDAELAIVRNEYDGGLRKIHAIKRIREIKGLGLADAKFTLERMEDMGLLK
jgi:hypothetical protein